MKKTVSLILCVALLMSVCIGPAAAVESKNGISTFSLDQIDPQMSLLDALEQYPEIRNVFYIDEITPEEAQALEASGVKSINGDEIPASILYSLNARKVHSDDSISPHGSSQNGPWPYEQVNGSVANCYGYALGIREKQNPGWFSGHSLPTVPNKFDVYQIADYVNKDMVATFNGAARQVSYQQTINSWEWRIAARVGNLIINWPDGSSELLRDYHFWLQTSTKTWCHKPGDGNSVNLGSVRPDTADWNLLYKGVLFENFYDSPTVYMALYRMD